jgi:glycosyltransferase involved in cell wall biosynthesis
VKVLFIEKRCYTNRDALRERYGRIYQLPSFWAKAGVETKLWLIDYHSRGMVFEKIENVEIESTPVRIFAFAENWFRQYFARDKKYNVIVASGDCYIGLAAYVLARRARARFVFDVYDKYDEFGGYRGLPGFDPFSFLLKRADVRLFASRVLMHDLTKAEHDILVPNGVDLWHFFPRDKEESRIELGLPRDTLLVGYFGGMEPDRGVADLITAVQSPRDEGMNIDLLLGGKTVAGLNVRQPGVCYLGNVPYERMPFALSACDLLAMPYRRSAFMDAGASNKIVETIACLRPLVATMTPNLVANFLSQARCLEGLLATTGDPADLVRVIRAQSERQVLVDMPAGMSWADISMDVTDRLTLHASWHFAPTIGAGLADGRYRGRSHPRHRQYLYRCVATDDQRNEGGISKAFGRSILLTVHRCESFGAPLRDIFIAVLKIVERFPDISITYPVHPNLNVRQPANEILSGHPRIRLCDPLDYFEFVEQMRYSTLILIDSGGVQKEIFALLADLDLLAGMSQVRYSYGDGDGKANRGYTAQDMTWRR